MTKAWFEPEGPDETGDGSRQLGSSLLWFVGIAAVSVVVVASVAYVLRGLLLIG